MRTQIPVVLGTHSPNAPLRAGNAIGFAIGFGPSGLFLVAEARVAKCTFVFGGDTGRIERVLATEPMKKGFLASTSVVHLCGATHGVELSLVKFCHSDFGRLPVNFSCRRVAFLGLTLFPP